MTDGFGKQAIPRIRSGVGQPGLPRSPSIDAIKADMVAGTFEYEKLEARISGWLDEQGTVYISDGHHRVNAALEVYWETNDPTCLDRLIEHGCWRRTPPPVDRRFPTRRFWSRVLSFLEDWMT